MDLCNKQIAGLFKDHDQLAKGSHALHSPLSIPVVGPLTYNWDMWWAQLSINPHGQEHSRGHSSEELGYHSSYPSCPIFRHYTVHLQLLMFSPFMDVCVTSHFKVIILIILIHSFVLVAGWILLVPENQDSQIMWTSSQIHSETHVRMCRTSKWFNIRAWTNWVRICLHICPRYWWSRVHQSQMAALNIAWLTSHCPDLWR